MKQLFITISDRLKAQVPELRWIDADYGQAEDYQMRASVAFPAALVRIATTAEENGGGTQLNNASVTIKLLLNPITNRTEAHTNEQIRKNALYYYDIADKVYLALQGFKTNDYTAFECIAKEQENRSDGLLIFRLAFTTSYWDFRAENE